MIHPTADVAAGARIGDGTKLWNGVQVREGVVIGRDCNLGKDVYVDTGVVIGDRVKVQNSVSLFRGVTLEDGVFVGPCATFTNDLWPRSIRPDGCLRDDKDWAVVPTLVRYGASIGANATIICGITIGRWAMVAAGAVVTGDVPDHGLVVGVPARLVGYVCECGRKLAGGGRAWRCPACGRAFDLPPLPGAAAGGAARRSRKGRTGAASAT